MSFNSSNKNDTNKLELTSSAKKLFRRATEIKDDSNKNLFVKSGNFKKAQIEGDRFIPSRGNLDSTNTQYFILQNKFNKEVKISQSNLNTSNGNVNAHSTSSQNIDDNNLVTANSNTNFQNYLVDMNLTSNSSIFDINAINNSSVNFSENDSILSRERILNFSSKTKTIPNFMSNLKSILEKNNNSQYILKKPNRQISTIPERVLDAPLLMDDYYLNLVDWSSTNILSVCLGNSLYLWNGNTQDTQLLMESNDYISSVSWMESGSCIAVGLLNGSVQLWDTNKMSQIRNMTGHTQRVGSLAWNKYILSSGSRDSKIYNHDVRIKEHITQCLVGHTQEICGMKWSNDGSLLASGGNDNLLCIWDVNLSNNQYIIPTINHIPSNSNRNQTTNNNNNSLFNIQSSEIHNNNVRQSIQNNENILLNLPNYNENSNSNSTRNLFMNNNGNDNNLSNVKYFSPKFKLNSHKSAVKALSWCPWQKSLLATGGGKQDKTIKFWNTELGTIVKSIDTNSQVCSLIWNRFEKEIISSHGYSKNQLSLWKYPEMTKIIELTGHMERVLYMALSPDGTTVVSGACDETLRFWKVFQPTVQEKDRKEGNSNTFNNLSNNFNIR